MNVLHLISGGDKGGAKTHVFTLLAALSEQIDVTVMCVMDGVFYQEIQDMPIKSVLFEQTYRNDLTVLGPMVKYIRAQGYQLIHAHGARANFIAMFLRRLVKLPVVTTVHSDYKLDFTDNVYKKHVYTGLNVFSLKRMDYYIAVSAQFKSMLVSRGFKPNDVYTVYNTIDFDQQVAVQDKADFLRTHGLPTDTQLVGIIGRLDQVKGHEVFVSAAAQVLQHHPQTTFLIAGEGPEEQNLRNQANQLGIGDKLHFLGFVDDIFSFLHAIDVNVLTSHSESFPYVLLEGARMKKPTVSTHVGGIGDLLKPGETGCLAEPGDPASVAQHLMAMLSDPGQATQLGHNLFTYAREHFSKESMKQRHLAIYRDVLARAKPQAPVYDMMLCGYYGFGNSGDEALLTAVMASVRKYKPDTKFVVLSKKPAETMLRHQVDAINRYNPRIAGVMKRTKLFAYGGGSILQDSTSTRSLIYYTNMLKLAKWRGLKLMIYANGIGPISQVSNQRRAKEALALCDYVSLREPHSQQELAKLDVHTDAPVTIDPAFNLLPSDNLPPGVNLDTSHSYMGVNLRQWKHNAPDLVKQVAQAIQATHAQQGVIPVYIPMDQQDYAIIHQVIKAANTPHLLLPAIYDVAQTMAIIKRTQLVLSMRLHTLVYAVSVGVPVMGLSYDPKIDFFMDYVGQPLVVSTASMDGAHLSEMIAKIFHHHQTIVTAIEARGAYLKTLSDQDAQAAIGLLS